MDKTKIQDELMLSLIEKGIKLYSEKLLNDSNIMDYLNQMNRIRRFFGYDTLKRNEFMSIMSVTVGEKT